MSFRGFERKTKKGSTLPPGKMRLSREIDLITHYLLHLSSVCYESKHQLQLCPDVENRTADVIFVEMEKNTFPLFGLKIE